MAIQSSFTSWSATSSRANLNRSQLVKTLARARGPAQPQRISNASLRKAGNSFSTIWSKDFTDSFFRQGLRQWLLDGNIRHDTSHVRDLDISALPKDEVELGKALDRQLLRQKAILGVFDEGCMGMSNANRIGIFKERLSQSSLFADMRSVTDEEAGNVHKWLLERGVHFIYRT
jgi:hypothetical protein